MMVAQVQKMITRLVQDATSVTKSTDDDLLIPGFDSVDSQANPPSTDPQITTVASDAVDDAPSNEHPTGRAPTDENAPRIFGLVGATGGVGNTSLATQLAHEYATHLATKRTFQKGPIDPKICLVDLDFESGACAHHLDLFPSLRLEDLCGPAEHIDTAFTQSLVSTHESGIALLAAPNTIGANSKINPYTVMAMLDAAADLFDTVIIDMPRYHQPWTLPIMRAVDVLAITCELTIPSLHATRERLAQLAKDANGAVNAQVVLSKYERRSFKNTLRLSDAETALGRSVLTTMCLDPDTTREALNCGEPAGVIRPDSRFVKDVRKLSTILNSYSPKALAKAA